MHQREVTATPQLIVIGVILSLTVGIAAMAFEAPTSSRVVLGLCYLIGLIGAGRASWVLRYRPHAYSTVDALLLGCTTQLAISMGEYYFGYYSPAPLASMMCLFFFGVLPRLSVAVAVYAITAVVHAAAMILLSMDVLPDQGLIRLAEISTAKEIAAIILVQVVYALTFIIARAVNAAIESSTRELEEAVRGVAHREALLLEARRELDRALQVGGPGRFTEQQLGDWRLGVLRGRGAMGDIYEATHVTTGELVAVKLLHPDAFSQPDAVQRFAREARVAQSIDEPHVVRVIDILTDDASVPFIVMELLEGHDLAHELRTRRRLPPEEVAELLTQVSRGVDAAHRAGIVHRDLKPQNLFRTGGDATPFWKVLDFGVARLLDGSSTLTRGQAIGTPSYMSPEQARGRECDHRADVFSLGVLAYRSLTGRPAFAGRDVPQILYDVVHAMPPRPSSLADVPREVDAVLAISMAKSAERRFDSAPAFAAALTAALAGEISESLAERARGLHRDLPWRG